jgi:hypothetical protein
MLRRITLSVLIVLFVVCVLLLRFSFKTCEICKLNLLVKNNSTAYELANKISALNTNNIDSVTTRGIYKNGEEFMYIGSNYCKTILFNKKFQKCEIEIVDEQGRVLLIQFDENGVFKKKRIFQTSSYTENIFFQLP